LQKIPDALLVLAPRHPERFTRVAQSARDYGLRTELYSQGEACSPQAQCFVIDTVGELMTYYACGDVAYVGGGIGDQGGHNALEPAALGIPVLFGPDMDNARDIADRLLSCNAAQEISNAREFSETVKSVLSDENLRARMGRAGRELVASNRGALEATLSAVQNFI
jgi:3-deoxy-D-manno-octulosonic-acid transferase